MNDNIRTDVVSSLSSHGVPWLGVVLSLWFPSHVSMATVFLCYPLPDGAQVQIRCCRVKPCPFILHCSSSVRCMNEYLAIDSGGYFCTKSLCILIAAWLGASQREVEMVFD